MVEINHDVIVNCEDIPMVLVREGRKSETDGLVIRRLAEGT